MKKYYFSAIIVLFLILLTASVRLEAYSFKGADINLQSSIVGIYDDNINFVKDSRKQDFITDIAVSLGLKSEKKRQNWEFLSNINQQIFSKENGFNNTSGYLSFNFQKELSKYDSVSLKNIFSHTYEPRSFEEAFDRTQGRYSYYINRFNLEYLKNITKQLNFTASYFNEMNEITRENINDSYFNSLTMAADYSFSSANIFLVSCGVGNRKLDTGDKAAIYTLDTGLRRYLTSTLYLDIKTGLNFVDAYNKQNITKPVLHFALSGETKKFRTLTLYFDKQQSLTAYTKDTFNLWKFSFDFTRQLLEKLAASFSCFYGEGKYTASEVTDKLKGIDIALFYDLREDLKGNMRYSYSQVDSTSATGGYERNRISLGLTMDF